MPKESRSKQDVFFETKTTPLDNNNKQPTGDTGSPVIKVSLEQITHAIISHHDGFIEFRRYRYTLCDRLGSIADSEFLLPYMMWSST